MMIIVELVSYLSIDYPMQQNVLSQHSYDIKLSYIYCRLMELEMARDDLLFELHKQPTQSPTDRNVS